MPLQQEAAHNSIMDLLHTGAITKLMREGREDWQLRHQPIYPQKFLDRTWRQLEREGIARWISHLSDYGVPVPLAFLMMSVLADVCSVPGTHKVTDQIKAYDWLSEALARRLQSPYVTGPDIDLIAPDYDRIVALSMVAIDARNVSLENLLKFRRSELRNGADHKAMRRHYQAAVQKCADRIGSEARTSADIREIERQFFEDIRDDLKELKKELGLATWKALLSKEVILTVLLLAGAITAPVAALTALGISVGALGIIPVGRGIIEYRGARRKALTSHASSWLFLQK
jgi:hypothetical protein